MLGRIIPPYIFCSFHARGTQLAKHTWRNRVINRLENLRMSSSVSLSFLLGMDLTAESTHVNLQFFASFTFDKVVEFV